jgi:hypothetical protein
MYLVFLHKSQVISTLLSSSPSSSSALQVVKSWPPSEVSSTYTVICVTILLVYALLTFHKRLILLRELFD